MDNKASRKRKSQSTGEQRPGQCQGPCTGLLALMRPKDSLLRLMCYVLSACCKAGNALMHQIHGVFVADLHSCLWRALSRAEI